MSPDPFRAGLRREIAIALSGGRKRTQYETAKAVGRPSGGISRTLRQMVEAGVVRADSAEPTRGTLYWLDDAMGQVLADSISESQRPGEVAPGQRLLLTSTTDSSNASDLMRVLTRRELARSIVWAAAWGGEGEWILALTPGASLTEAQRLAGVLRDADIKCRVGEIRDVLAGEALQLMAASVADAVEANR